MHAEETYTRPKRCTRKNHARRRIGVRIDVRTAQRSMRPERCARRGHTCAQRDTCTEVTRVVKRCACRGHMHTQRDARAEVMRAVERCAHRGEASALRDVRAKDMRALETVHVPEACTHLRRRAHQWHTRAPKMHASRRCTRALARDRVGRGIASCARLDAS